MKKILTIVSAVLLLGAGCASNMGKAPSNVAPADGFSAPLPPVAVPPDQFSGSPAPQQAAPPVDTGKNPLAPDTNQKPMPKTWQFPGVFASSEIHGKQIHIHTAKGDIVFKLYDGDAPKTVSNFVYLTKGGFYDGLTFHRREEGFVIQGGDPNGTGTGGPGYQFEDEKVTRQYTKGIVAMANAGANTNGSQFFIMLENNPLPPQYTVFGEVTQGMDVVANIKVGDVMQKVTVEPQK